MRPVMASAARGEHIARMGGRANDWDWAGAKTLSGFSLPSVALRRGAWWGEGGGRSILWGAGGFGGLSLGS
jgi:hypothetical protein